MERKPEPHDLLVALLLVQSSLERRSEAFFQPFGLTSAQFNILNLLGYHEGKMDQAALVNLLLWVNRVFRSCSTVSSAMA